MSRLRKLGVFRLWLSHDAGYDRGHDLVDDSGFAGRAVPAGEQQTPGPDQHGCKRVAVGIRRDTAEFPLGGQV